MLWPMSTVRVPPPSSLPAGPDQLVLFDAGVDVARLRRAREVLLLANKAANTEAAYRSAWRLFCRWCLDAGRVSLPATPETVSLYVMALLESRYRLQTIRVRLAGLADRHVAGGFATPVDDTVRLLLSNAARTLRERSQGKAAITIDHVRRVAALCRSGDAKSVRDHAIFMAGFALGWRRSELSSLDAADVSFRGSRGVVVSLGASKTDQVGRGRVVVLPCGACALTCPVRALRSWMDVRGGWRGPLFCRFDGQRRMLRARLGASAVCLVIQDLLRAIGEDASAYGAHSLRAGMVTAAAENGSGEVAIMQRTGHRSVATVLEYVRPAQGFRVDPLAGVL